MKEFEKLKVFYKKKKIIVTGHTGFKGSWLTLLLDELGSNTLGVSDKFLKNPSLFKTIKYKKLKTKICDVSNLTKFKKIIFKYKPDLIFHLAAQSIVSESYKKPYNTVISNTFGV